MLLLTGTLIFDEVKLQAFFECVFVDIILNTNPRTREKEIFINLSLKQHCTSTIEKINES